MGRTDEGATRQPCYQVSAPLEVFSMDHVLCSWAWHQPPTIAREGRKQPFQFRACSIFGSKPALSRRLGLRLTGYRSSCSPSRSWCASHYCKSLRGSTGVAVGPSYGPCLILAGSVLSTPGWYMIYSLYVLGSRLRVHSRGPWFGL